MPPQKTLEERVKELEERVDFANAKIFTISFFTVLGFLIVVLGTKQNFVRMSEAIGKMEQSTRQTGKE